MLSVTNYYKVLFILPSEGNNHVTSTTYQINFQYFVVIDR